MESELGRGCIVAQGARNNRRRGVLSAVNLWVVSTVLAYTMQNGTTFGSNESLLDH